ncbi:urease accessory protein UreF [Sphaerimonospora sp. CA-214678]|uniref:urease accessory protein UreF n=1 Tax=Sphaerimonospora sp. CA-214678 TaxID=3240029 RepID=UPI003D8A649F
MNVHAGHATDPGHGGRACPGLATLLLLTDGRYPSGAHAHSGGLEAAAAAGLVHDTATLAAFLTGRAATGGVTAAAFAAASCARFPDGAADAAHPPGHGGGGNGPRPGLGDVFGLLDVELDARIPSPALRAASRRLGRQFLRAALAMRPHPGLGALAGGPYGGPHQPIALGATAGALGLTPRAAAAAALHETVTGPATAAIRLLGLDPFAVHAILVRLAPELDELAHAAAGHALAPPDRLPSPGAPLLDVLAEAHARWEVRLFAS